jgi:single-strand DNA-binding protein
MNTIRNTVQIVGNLGRNPEIKTLDNGKKVAKIWLAVTETYKDADGKKIENTQWFNAVAWEALAILAEKFMHKGKQIAVSGKLQNRNWTDKEGKKHYTTEIVCNDILLLGGAQKKD